MTFTEILIPAAGSLIALAGYMLALFTKARAKDGKAR